ncbi:shisa family member 2a [Megalops cyprinoides]|uniref:shisa family member 2a n=1 Tax=Megalops cyprinoides TaxID=118141 RepID=UPI0018653BA8|nr:shisa family member 2a [Megalops cyprinoides]
MAVSFLVCSLYLLISALQPGDVGANGEYCHGWADAYNIWHKGFQCPERYDGEDARYCCGTCTLRYCCTAAEARLDQSSCDNDNFFEFENDEKTNQKNPQVPTYLPFLIVAGAFVSFVVVGSVVAVCCCHCLKPKPRERQGGSVPVQSRLLESGGPSSDGMTPSRHSSASSSSAGRSTVARQQNACTMGTEVTVNMYGAGNGHPIMGPQVQQYLPAAHGPFFQPYVNYGMPPEHNILMTQAYLDNRSTYSQHQAQPFPQAPMHTEPLYPGVTL